MIINQYDNILLISKIHRVFLFAFENKDTCAILCGSGQDGDQILYNDVVNQFIWITVIVFVKQLKDLMESVGLCPHGGF